MTLTDRVKFLQKAALIHRGQVLILKRSLESSSRPGAWDLPGGRAEWPVVTTQSLENPHQGEIAREIREETGLVVDPSHFTDQNLVHFKTYFEADRQRYALICGWRVLAENIADFDPDALTLSEEHTEFAWVTLETLDQYDFDEPTGAFVKTIIRNAFTKE